MNLCRPWPQGSRSGGVAEVADRVCCGGAYGSLQPPPSVFKQNTKPYTSRRGAGRRCLARGERRHGSRGEPEGDCAYAAESLRTAAEIVPVRGARGGGFTATYEILSSPGFKIPARFDGKQRTIGRRGKCRTTPSRNLAVQISGSRRQGEVELLTRRGGHGDRSSYSRDRRSGGGTPPYFIAGVISDAWPDPGIPKG